MSGIPSFALVLRDLYIPAHWTITYQFKCNFFHGSPLLDYMATDHRNSLSFVKVFKAVSKCKINSKIFSTRLSDKGDVVESADNQKVKTSVGSNERACPPQTTAFN